jgi:FkbM family methyltransferase
MTDSSPSGIPLVSYAQNFEDVILWRALKQIPNGFYIDVGAQDPVEDSVSCGFYEQGWRGVHVEPTLYYAEKLRQARPEETVIQAAVAADAGLLHFYEIVETGLSTGDAAQAEHHRQAGFTVRETDVPSMPLGALLDRYGDRPIHWLKIDVEGLEEQVLQSWGNSPARPWIVVVEAVVPGTQIPSHEGWDSLLVGKGYRSVHFDGLNRYYLSDQQEQLAEHFRSGPNVFDEFVLSGTSTNRFSKLLLNRIEDLQQRFDLANESHAFQQEESKTKLIATIRDLTHARTEALHFREALDELYKTHTAAVQDHALQAQNAATAFRDAEIEAARKQEELRGELYIVNVRLANVLNSSSWKVTRPLRLAGRLVARLRQALRALPRRLAALPRRIPAALIGAVRARPGLKRLLVALINRVPGLAVRARRYANRPATPTITAAPIARPADPSGAHLSASARKVRARLAVPRPHAGNTP